MKTSRIRFVLFMTVFACLPGTRVSADEPLPPPQRTEVWCGSQRTVVIAYDGGTRGPADRRITPRAMLQSNGRQYLIAYCHAAKLEKTYRLDRIRKIHAAEM